MSLVASGKGKHMLSLTSAGKDRILPRGQLTEVVKVERVFPRQGAVEASFEEGGPAVLVLVGAALIRLADASHPGINALERKEDKNTIISNGQSVTVTRKVIFVF